MFYGLVNAYTRQFSFPARGLKYFLRLARWLNIADKIYKKKLPDGFYMNLNPAEHIQQQLFWYGYYEKELGDLIKKALKPGDVFLDIGANIGYFSLLVATREASSTVVAFEPVKNVFESLKENVRINDIKNIITINAALGDTNEEKEIFISAKDNLGMSSFKQPENYSGRKEKVKVLCVDDWFRSFALPKVDLVKIDTEGSEVTILKGMYQLLEQFRPLIIVEVNPGTLGMFNLSSKDILNHLKQLNFEPCLILKNGSLEKSATDINSTINVLFIHNDKMADYAALFNKR